jgi:hypothetical protein
MAIKTTLEMDGTNNLPSPTEVGKVYEYTFTHDTTSVSLDNGDFLQLAYVPEGAVITQIVAESSGTTTATLDVGIADNLVTTAITSMIDFGTLTANTAELAYIYDDASAVSRILAVGVTTAAEATATAVRFRIQYQAG